MLFIVCVTDVAEVVTGMEDYCKDSANNRKRLNANLQTFVWNCLSAPAYADTEPDRFAPSERRFTYDQRTKTLTITFNHQKLGNVIIIFCSIFLVKFVFFYLFEFILFQSNRSRL